MRTTISHAELLRVLNYFPDTCVFTWRVKTANKSVAGKAAGSLKNGKYQRLCINKTFYLSHRLAWFYVYGEWPNNLIDHINGEKDDNRIANLRQANAAENARNTGLRSTNTSGVKGVGWVKRRKKFQAQLRTPEGPVNLGMFGDLRQAEEAVNAAREQMHGDFHRHK
jgi:hypothetical protein